MKNSSGASAFFSCKLPTLMMFADRLKKVQGKKKRDAEAAEAKRRADLAAQELDSDPAAPAAPSAATPIVDESIASDLLSSKDADVIF